MEFKEGDKVTFKSFGIRKERDTLIVSDIRQIPLQYNGKYSIDETMGYILKQGVIHNVFPNAREVGFNWDGKLFFVYCGDKYKGVCTDNAIPYEWIETNEK